MAHLQRVPWSASRQDRSPLATALFLVATMLACVLAGIAGAASNPLLSRHVDIEATVAPQNMGAGAATVLTRNTSINDASSAPPVLSTSVEELVCPMGWTKVAFPVAEATPDPTNTAYACARVMGDAVDLVAPFDTIVFCGAAFSLYPPRLSSGDSPYLILNNRNYTYAFEKATVQPVSVHSSDGNAVVSRLFTAAMPGKNLSETVVSLGGRAGFGEVSWFDQSSSSSSSANTEAASVYENFDDASGWRVHSGCIGMRLSDGKWVLLPCREGEAAYLCTFPLTTDLVHAVPADGEDDRSSANGGDASSSAPSSSEGHGEPQPPKYVVRPPVPEPVPACLPGWIPLPATGTTTTQAGAMCYRAYAPAGELGTYGKTFDAANNFCAAQHPRGTIASVLSAKENTWVLQEVLLRESRLAALAAEAGENAITTPSSPSSGTVTQARRTVVFLGARFMRAGTDALLGEWYGDQYLFNETDYAKTEPSSPAWPTSLNGYFSDWAVQQPRSSYGCLAMALYDMRYTATYPDGTTQVSNIAAGQWVSEDCRATQPFVCAYVNDGSTFPPVTGSSSSAAASSSNGELTTMDPSSLCLPGWSLYAPTGTCYRVALATASNAPSTALTMDRGVALGDDEYQDAATGPVSPVTLDDRCGHDLVGRATNPEIVRSAGITSAEESVFVGSLLAELSAAVEATGRPRLNTTLVGISYYEDGSEGRYFDLSLTWRQPLAESLWASGQPSQRMGCIAVDTQGLWSYVPCGSVGEAYTCQYAAAELVRKDEPPPASTDEPAPTRTPRPTPSESVPLTERIASLSGAVHLVVSAGTMGTYTIESRGGIVDGLLFYFAPVSPYFTHPESTSVLPAGPSPFGQLLFGADTYAPCAGYKKQEELSAAVDDKLTVYHGRKLPSDSGESTFINEVGYVCVSEDGKHYVPTRITYEVVGATLTGLVPLSPRSNTTSVEDGGASQKMTTFLPPILLDPQAALAAAQTDLGITRYSSGLLQLAVQPDRERTSLHFRASGTTPSEAALSQANEQSYLTHIRLSSEPDCMNPKYTFLYRDLPITETTAMSANGNSSSRDTAYAISYQWADIAITNLSRVHRLEDPLTEDEIPVEFYVCVAARKRQSATSALFPFWNTTHVSANDELVFSNASQAASLAVANAIAMKRLAARGSLAAPRRTDPAAADQEVVLYTAVPGLRVHVVAPAVSLNGMWVLPPQPLTHAAFAANATRAVRANALHPQLLIKQSTAPGLSGYLPSATTVHVPQYSSPILVLDGEGIGEGMSLLLSRLPSDADDDAASGDRCSRTQWIPRRDAANRDVPASLDTMLPLSLLKVPVTVLTDGDAQDAVTAPEVRKKKIAFTQLNLNITGMWGTRMNQQSAQRWRVCFSYSTTGEFLPIKPLTIVVDRMNIAAITAVTAAGSMDNEEEDDAALYAPLAGVNESSANAGTSTAVKRSPQLNVNVGFTGLWRLWGLDVRMWSATTLYNAQVTFSMGLPLVDGDEIDPTEQCSTPSLFYNQKGLGIVAPPGAATMGGLPPTHNVSSSSASTYAAVVIPPGFMQDISVRRMRLCLSIPQPFHATRRVFYPTAITIDVRPIQILYIGRYSAVPGPTTSAPAENAGDALGTVLRVAEEADNVAFPLVGYGLRPDMMLFLSDRPCYGHDLVGDMDDLVGRQSLFNLSLTAPYDLPPNYWASADVDLPTDWEEASAANTSRRGNDEALSHQQPPASKVYMVLTQDTLTARPIADRLFGTPRTPLRLCLFAPGTRGEVYSTAFRMVVLPPSTGSMTNIAEKDAALVSLAMGNRTFHPHQQQNDTAAVVPPEQPLEDGDEKTGDLFEESSSVESDSFVSASGEAAPSLLDLAPQPRVTALGDARSTADADAVVVYAAYMDLLVDGFGLLQDETQFIPAVDCSNASSFLWRNPVGLSPIPSSRGRDFFAQSKRYQDPQASMSSWYIPLRQSETTRIGAEEPNDGLVTRFTWCVRYRARDAYENVTTEGSHSDRDDVSRSEPASSTWVYNWTKGFVSTGIPYHLVIPRVDGFRFGNRISQRLTLPVQDKELGQWQRIQLVGPLIDITFEVGNPLYMFLADEALSCKDVKNYYIAQNLTAEKMILAVNGSAVLMPKLLSTAGTYKFCTSAVYPEARSAELGTEAALQFFDLPGLRLTLFDPVYAIFSLNHTSSVKVEHGQEWTLPLETSQLSNYSLLRFQPRGTGCASPMVVPTSHGGERVLPDITVRNMFEGYDLFGMNVTSSGQYVVLEREFIEALPAPQTYQLCFKPNRATPWMASDVTLRVVEHVRRPTRYNYFAEDGSEDVVAMTALAPTKVAQAWLTGEAHTDNIVGALGREVALALQCLNGHTDDVTECDCSASSSSAAAAAASSGGNSSDAASSLPASSSGKGCQCDVQTDQRVPCGNHRRVMFVKPMDDDADPCFVDYEAIQSTIIRGPYIIDDGILTIPRSVSGVNVSFYPNMTQPWILCLETGPERWREPVYPLVQLQYSGAIPVGFRTEPDDPSNTTATFPGTTGAPPTSTEDRSEAEGNATLVLFAMDSSQVYYLNGYGIQRGFFMRFGARCEEDITEEQMAAADVTADNVSRLVASRQRLANTLLYEQPLQIEDDHGVFLVPRTHQLFEETYVLPMCLSTNGGLSYAKTNLSVTVLPSRLKRDVPSQEEDLVERVLGDTLVVPHSSTGSVNVTDLAARAAEKLAQANQHANGGGTGGVIDLGSGSSAGEDENDANGGGGIGWPVGDEGVTTSTRSPSDREEAQAATPFFPPGTEVLISSSCSYNVEGLPLLTVSVPNVFTLTTHHTRTPSDTRLRICARFPESSGNAPSQNNPSMSTSTTWSPGNGGFPTGGNTHEVLGDDDEDSSSNSLNIGSDGTGAGAARPVYGFKDTGLYYRVLGVSVASVSVHDWSGNDEVTRKGIDQLVLRRSAEDLLLSVSLSSSGVPTAPGDNAVDEIGAICTQDKAVSEDCIKEVFLHMLDAPGALPFFSLARFAIGKPCLDVRDSADRAPPSTVVSSTAFKASFSNSSLTVTTLYGDGDVRFVAPLPADPAEVAQQLYPPWAPASLCLSVDGGRHYLSIGIAYFTADWAPTLRAQINPLDDDDSDETPTPTYTNNITIYEQTSIYAKLSDTRYDASIYYNPVTPNATTPPFEVTPANAYLNRFTMDALWSGFLGESGFASQGVLYIPSTLAHLSDTSSGSTDTDTEATTISQELLFYASNRFIERASASTSDGDNFAGAGERTSLHLVVEPFHLFCVGDADYTVAEEYMRRLDNGRLLPVANQCGGAGIPEGTTLRLVDSHQGTLSAKDACALPAAYSAGVFAFDMSVVKPFLWAPPSSKTTTTNALTSEDGLEESATQIQLPPSLRYVPDGTYHVCVKKYLWSYKEASRRQEEAVFVSSSVRLMVTANLTVLRVARATSGIIAVYQGSNSAVPIEGTAVGLRGMPLLMAFAPVLPHQVILKNGQTMNLTRGCLDVPRLHDPVTGQSLINLTASAAQTNSPPEDLLLTAPWQDAQDGLWRVPAAYLRYITNQTLYFLCYSVDGGLTFDFIVNRLADVSLYEGEANAGPIPRVVTVAVRPPTMVGAALNATAQGVVAQDMYTRRSTALRFDPNWMTASTLRVHRFSHVSNATNTDLANPMLPSPAQPAAVRTFTYTTLLNGQQSPVELQARAPSYYYNPTSALVGNGMGINSFRTFWPAPSSLAATSGSDEQSTVDGRQRVLGNDTDAFTAGYFEEEEEAPVFASVEDRVPSVAAAIAVLRTSRFGQICSGPLPNHNVSYHTPATSTLASGNAADGVLAMPLFLLNLKTTTVWSEADEARFDQAVADLEKTNPRLGAAARAMNPVLARDDLRRNTDMLRERYQTTAHDGVLNLLSVLALATTEAEAAARTTGESLLVCVSVDGVNFLSANAPVLPSVGSLSSAYVAVPGVNSDAARRAMRLRRLAATAPSNRPIPLLNVSSVPMFLRPEPAPVLTSTQSGSSASAEAAQLSAGMVGTFFARDLSVRTSLVVRPNLTALKEDLEAIRVSPNATTTEKAEAEAELAKLSAALAAMSPAQWRSALSVVPSPQMLTHFVDGLSQAVGVESAVFLAQLQPTGSVAAPSVAAASSEAFRTRLVQRAASADPVTFDETHTDEQDATTTTTTSYAPSAGVSSLHMPTYDLIISIAADAYLINVTSQERTLTPAPDILLRVVDALRHNVTQYNVLKPLLYFSSTSPAAAALSRDPTLSKVRAAAYVSSIAMNFTFGNGIDLSRMHNATSSSKAAPDHVVLLNGVNYTLPPSSAQETAWRNAFMSIPHDTVAAVPIPDDPNNDTTDKVTWWVVPLMLILPAFLIFGTYYVYKKYLKKKDPADEVTVEAAAAA